MADVLIKGMEMPGECLECRLADSEGFCTATQETITHWGIREDWCPLVEVPTHGRLIDASVLYEKAAEWEAQALHLVETHLHDEDTEEWRKWSTVLTERSAFKFDIADAPTVIEASEEDA